MKRLAMVVLVSCLFFLMGACSASKQHFGKKGSSEQVSKKSRHVGEKGSGKHFVKRKIKQKIKWIKCSTPISFPILMYHSISNNPGNRLCVPKEQFEHQLELLKRNGYYALDPQEAERVLTKNEKPAERIVWVTLDDGYRDNYASAFKAIKKTGIKATINLITSKINCKDPYYVNLDQIEEMKRTGLVSFGSHTVHHLELNRMSYDQQFQEMNDSKVWLDQKLNQKTEYLCYPVGRCNNQTAIAAQKAGYSLATTTQPGLANVNEGMYGLKRVRIVPDISDSGFIQLLSTGY